MRTTILVVLLGSLLLGCGAKHRPSLGSSNNDEKFMEEFISSSSHHSTLSTRVVIRNAVIMLTVKNVKEAAGAVESIAASFGGHILDSKVYPDSSGVISAKVPAKKLNRMLMAVRKLGKVTSEEISTEDVTEQLIDFKETLKSKIVLRERLRSLLKKTSVVDEILKIENQLARLQGEIDSMQGRIKSIEICVAMSSVRVEFQQKYEPPEEGRRILGPLGLLWKGTAWFFKKLWIIYP